MSRLWQYLLAFGFLVFVTGILVLLRSVLDTTPAALLYLIPPGVITARWELAPGITSARSY